MPNNVRPGWQLQSIFHFVVNASNLERSLAFYQTLGFSILSDRRDVIWPDFVADNFGLKKAQGRGCLLGLGDDYQPNQTRLDLVEWLEPRLHDDSGGLPLAERVPRIASRARSQARRRRLVVGLAGRRKPSWLTRSGGNDARLLR